jgi:hypothetical protein
MQSNFEDRAEDIAEGIAEGIAEDTQRLAVPLEIVCAETEKLLEKKHVCI